MQNRIMSRMRQTVFQRSAIELAITMYLDMGVFEDWIDTACSVLHKLVRARLRSRKG